MKKILIIGAGPAGLSCAHELMKSNEEISLDIIEKGNDVGGMCQSFSFSGFTVDLGPHRLFTTDKVVLNFWKEVLAEDLITIKRKTRIYFKNKFYDYPLNVIEAFWNFGLFDAVRAALSYITRKVRPYKDESHFEGWVSNQFGDYLYRIFFKGYSEKLWGISCRDLDSRFAKQRISGAGLLSSIIGAISRKRNRRIIEEFYYPRYGNGQLYQKIKMNLERRDNCHFFFNQTIQSISRHDKSYEVSYSTGEKRVYDFIVATLPIDELISLLDISKADALINNLKFRNTILVYLSLDKKDIFLDQWLYIQDGKKRIGRITNFNNWSPEQGSDFSKTIIALEFWCFEDEKIWSWDDEYIVKRASEEMNDFPIFSGVEILESKVIRVRKSYPVYIKGHDLELDKIKNFLLAYPQIIPIGRAGSFKYNNQDHSNLMGILAAKNILGQENHDLWQINTDTSYQERAN